MQKNAISLYVCKKNNNDKHTNRFHFTPTYGKTWTSVTSYLDFTQFLFLFFFFQYTLVLVLFSLCMCPVAALIMQFNPFLDAWRLQKPSHRVNLAQSNGSLCPIIPDPEIGDIASRKPSFQMEVRLYGLKAAAWLQVAADGTVNGTLNTTSEFGRKVIYNPTLMTS